MTECFRRWVASFRTVSPPERAEASTGSDFGAAPLLQPALLDVSLAVNAGQTIILFGAAGSGKTVRLKRAPIRPEAGRVYLSGQQINQLRQQELFWLHRRVRVLAQEGVRRDPLQSDMMERHWTEQRSALSEETQARRNFSSRVHKIRQRRFGNTTEGASALVNNHCAFNKGQRLR
jgi:ABC-type oligopeptide transport system ATPase subunit